MRKTKREMAMDYLTNKISPLLFRRSQAKKARIHSEMSVMETELPAGVKWIRDPTLKVVQIEDGTFRLSSGGVIRGQ